MKAKKAKRPSAEIEVLEDLHELEALVPQIPAHQSEFHFQLMMAEIIDKIQDRCPVARQNAALRKIVAQFGDAYFFYNQTGDFCLLTDFLYEIKQVEKAL